MRNLRAVPAGLAGKPDRFVVFLFGQRLGHSALQVIGYILCRQFLRRRRQHQARGNRNGMCFHRFDRSHCEMSAAKRDGFCKTTPSADAGAAIYQIHKS
jgi:hypothetical protein